MTCALVGQALRAPHAADTPQGMIADLVEEREDVRAEYRRALKWLFSFANYEIVPALAYEASKFNLERMRALLATLGSPQEKFESVHIAGTKGKGSTAAICESILRAAGYKTGLYTSPHLHTFRERICVEGALIEPEAIVEGVARLREIQPQFPDVSVFELMTALAFDYFARAGVQVAVVEVGIGGRLDATNVITPRVSVLTSISYDHTTVLGDTLTKIASEKAGIIKTGVPVVSAPQVDEALVVLQQVARERNAPLTLLGRDWKWKPLAQNLEYQDFRVVGQVANLSYDLRLHLLGAHQLANATAAIAAALLLADGGAPITAEAICPGVANACWPGRFEVLERAPCLVADGAHNRDSARQLVATLDALLPGAKVHWVFGASSDKDIGGIFDELLARSSELIITRSKHPRAADPHDLASFAQERGLYTVVADSVADALDIAHRRVDCADVIVVTGSLFVVAEARAIILRARGEPVESDE
jgi:dihydrofolate synthase / folylpolyglutamate synthase